MWTSRTVILSALLVLPELAPATTFRVGGGGGCTHATIQDAIDDAAADPEITDFIRITRSIAYEDVELDIHDQNVVVVGGYANCLDEIGDEVRTELGGDGDHTVVRIHGDGDVVLRNLTLSGGHQPRFNYGHGGGLRIEGGPHLVTTSNLLVTDNDAGHGGGISIVNDESDDPADVTLVLGNDVVISNNSAGYTAVAGDPGVHGGGVYCSRSTVIMNGADSTSVLDNIADADGGGIGAMDCALTIAPRGTFGSFNGLVLNRAGRDGGGLVAAGDSRVTIYTAHAERPVYIAANIAGREGGGMKLNSGARADAWDAIFEGNRSFDEGGAISMFVDYGASGNVSFTMQGTLGGAPADAANCAADRRCNRISANVAEDDDGTPKDAAAIRVKMTDNEVLGQAISARLDLRGTVIDGNTGASVVRVRQDCDFSGAANGFITLDGIVMTGNSVSGTLVLNPDAPYDCFSELGIRAATIAGNASGGGTVIGSTSHFAMDRSVVWQPGLRTIDAGGLADGSVQYVLASDFTDIPPSVTNFTADPRFVDPERGDFHLQAASPAIDYAPSSSEAEADDQPRSRDLALVPNDDGFGMQDLGAYELQSIGNLVRNPAFDDDLHIWTEVAPGISTWNPADRAGSATSGSLEIADDSPATRVTALRQCIGVPGPGVYRISGWGYVSADHTHADLPIVAWSYFANGDDCAGGAAASGEVAVVDETTGWHPTGARYIAVSPAEWAPGTSVGIDLVLQKGDDPLFPENGFGRFDDVSLVPDSDVIFADGFGP